MDIDIFTRDWYSKYKYAAQAAGRQVNPLPGKIEYGHTLAVQVTERLREDIISKRIEAGSRITIKDISERYGTSNMPVREAFRTLEGENLLEINAYKGATVLRIDEDFVRDVYGLMRALEALIYETALPEIDETVLEELRQVNLEIEKIPLTGKDEDRLPYLDLNARFHGLIMAHGKNKKALDLYQYHNMLVRALRKSYCPKKERIREATEEHRVLIAALASKDIVIVRQAVDTHVGHAMENFFTQYSQAP